MVSKFIRLNYKIFDEKFKRVFLLIIVVLFFISVKVKSLKEKFELLKGYENKMLEKKICKSNRKMRS